MSVDCIFCKIIKKEIPASVVYESDNVLAFEDIHPVAPVHVIMIPKTHIENVKTLTHNSVELVGELHLAAQDIAKIKGIEDYRLITNAGAGVGQSVFHLHYHLIGGKKMETLV